MIDYTIELEKVNEVFVRTSKITIEQQLELREAFSAKAKDFWFDPRVRAGTWDGTLRFYNMQTNCFAIGLMPYFINFCKKHNYKYKFNFDVSDLRCDIADDDIKQLYQKIFKNSFKPREYQDFAIKKALRNKRGIIEHPTASGKSIIIYSLIRFMLATSDRKVLLVVPNINLVEQMFSDFKDYGWNSCESYCSLIYGTSKRKDWNNQLIISTWQSIYKKDISHFKDFGMVIIDETHGAKASSLKTILEKCVNADFRIGLTGSLQDKNEKNEKADFLTISGYLGPVIAKENTQDLIDQGFLSNIIIANLLLKYPDEFIELTKFESYNYMQEIEIIQSYNKRNKVLDFILNNIDKSHNVLILCHEIEDHLKVVEDYISKNFKDWNFNVIYGQVNANKREIIRREMIQKGGNILLASYGTVSTGVNIPRLHHIIFFSSFRSKIKVLQSIGRGLRKHESKEKLILWDIVDDLTYKTYHAGKEVLHKNYVYIHWLQRLKYYKFQNFKFITKQIDLEKL
ncbi:MAG: DEAD/DEAH box helicase family protein [Candidatus Woesearchaeota archaeon]